MFQSKVPILKGYITNMKLLPTSLSKFTSCQNSLGEHSFASALASLYNLRDGPLMIGGPRARIRVEFFFLANRLMIFFPGQQADEFFMNNNYNY